MNDAVTGSGEPDAGAPGGRARTKTLLAGRYRVIRPIGSGGMARVVLAQDETLGRRVAVKVLDVDVVDEAAAGRAEIETRLLASLNHPGLVTLFDAHLTHEPRFLVMEHVIGTTLAARIVDEPLDARELSTLAVQLADALHVVHDAGIVHRDVKPSNILLARSAAPGVPFRAKLADSASRTSATTSTAPAPVPSSGPPPTSRPSSCAAPPPRRRRTSTRWAWCSWKRRRASAPSRRRRTTAVSWSRGSRANRRSRAPSTPPGPICSVR